ncbi:MAG TPA: phospholipase A [Burkholderiales bacterium]|nr:phospholipase A [Burkholderiales bacterium]
MNLRAITSTHSASAISIAILLFTANSSWAASLADYAQCAQIADEAERLKCYDALTKEAPDLPAPATEAESLSAAEQIAKTITATPLAQRWELDDETKGGTFNLRPHKPNYFLPVRYSSSPNNQPFSPSSGPVPQQPALDHAEVKFQLSFKTKIAENLFSDRADLWFAYTQQSHWQAYQEHPAFRETDYEPEIMLVFRTDYDLLGMKGRFINFGLVHQSNGRRGVLERGWNRAYLQFGYERGGFVLMVRPWWRIPEKTSSDDNPDISSYLGYGDVLAAYKRGEQTYSLLLRNNLSVNNNRGAVQFSWSFPIWSRLKGYVQLFSGYGESLIDYNHRQNTIGIGVVLTDWM